MIEAAPWVLSGAIVGALLGMTGGGGSLLAVPLLVYVHALSPQAAVGMSLATVGATAAWGAVRRWREGLLDLRIGLIVSVAGMLGAPAGAWVAGQLSPNVLLAAFAGLMLLAAARMGWTARPDSGHEAQAFHPAPQSACRTGDSGRLALTSRCAAVLAAAGLFVGVLSGLFGVGGGFVIVPALVLLAGMEIRRAVATSLLVVALVGLSGFLSHQIGGERLPLGPLGLFTAGGVVGLEIGSRIARRLPAHRLQQLFAGVIVLAAAAMLWEAVPS
ncbi:sulfite exporter TauE/SafE family protein [Alienimonas chondri]|uniref:Probable membrane transporter protein n=1 Tax=Alienimonas chondri TaxID=2681879 RepID=A0ABX1VCS8_9PLAN|nr:sulfite exporter TauE/SafE family protein [Alienimonas chondri]NNJ25917.1 hypothetical protein [Alienimonas chondri]